MTSAFNIYQRAILVATGIGAVSVFSATASAFINVELRPAFQTVSAGSNVSIGLYVVSDSASNQGLAAAQIIFSWQPAFLQMLSNDNSGAVPLLSSNFPSPDPYGINELSLPADGNAMYVGMASLGSPVFATPGGTLLTTLRFHALAPTSLSPITLLASAGSPPGTTVVFDSTVPNLSVTGTLTGAGVQIIPAPASCAALALLGASALRRRRNVP